MILSSNNERVVLGIDAAAVHQPGEEAVDEGQVPRRPRVVVGEAPARPRALRAREDDEETVAFGRDLYAAVVAEYLAEEGLVALQERRPARTFRSRQTGRADRSVPGRGGRP